MENCKKNIGIITFWDCPNFGSFLQAYALQKIVSEMYPEYDVKQIAYSNKKHMDVYYSIIRPSMFKNWPFNLSFYIDVIQRIINRKQIFNFRKFKDNYKKFIAHTKEYTAKTLLNEEFETVILGSDIIWDYSIPFFDNDKFLFGNDINCNNLISYAASFGTVKRSSKHPEYVINAFKKINAVSVRDYNSRLIAEDISEKKAEIVLDPTLIWNFNNDVNIKVPELEYKYAAVYGSFFTDDEIHGLKEYCKKHNLKIVFLDTGLDKCDWCDIFIDASTITPFEWCGYIKSSEILMTSTFHGFLFGLIFEKKIIFNATDFMQAKLSDFLNDLDLYNNLVKEKSFEFQIKYEWDYSRINKILEQKKKISLDFLRKNVIIGE